MKLLATISAVVLLAISAPALAQSAAGSSTNGELQQNGSPNGAGMSHEKQPGSAATQSGKAPGMIEGRSSATDPKGSDDANAPGQSGTAKMRAGEGDASQSNGAGAAGKIK